MYLGDEGSACVFCSNRFDILNVFRASSLDDGFIVLLCLAMILFSFILLKFMQ